MMRMLVDNQATRFVRLIYVRIGSLADLFTNISLMSAFEWKADVTVPLRMAAGGAIYRVLIRFSDSVQ